MSEAEVTGPERLRNARWLAVWSSVGRAIAARRGVLGLACIVIASFAYRLYVARVCSLWLDEVDTHLNALKPWSVVLTGPSRDHPPLMYALVKAAISTFGVSEIGLRVVSIVFGCVLLGAVYQLCVQLGLTVGRSLLVVATLALSPFFIRHATEARPYAMFGAFVTLATTRALRLLAGPVGTLDLVGFFVCTSAAAYTQYFGLAYGAALVGALTLGIRVPWKQSSVPRRVALVGTLGLLVAVLGLIAGRALSLARHFAVGSSGAREWHAFDPRLAREIMGEFSFLTNLSWSFWIQPGLAIAGLLILSFRLRGGARLLPLGLGFLPCAATLLVSAEHFIAPRYVAPSATWYHLGACIAVFAAIDQLRLRLSLFRRFTRFAPLFAGLSLAGFVGARLREFPAGFGTGTDDYRAFQRYFVDNLSGDTALVGYIGYFGEVLFGKEYRIGSKPIKLETFRPIRGVERYLVIEIHVDDERRVDLEALIVKKFGISVEEWRSLPLVPVPHSIYQPAVQARIVSFRGQPPPEPPRKKQKRRRVR
jgi:hypothetical protein